MLSFSVCLGVPLPLASALLFSQQPFQEAFVCKWVQACVGTLCVSTCKCAPVCVCVHVCGHLREPLHPGLREHVLYQLLRCSLVSGGNREISMWAGGHRAGCDKAGNPVYDVAVGGPSSDRAEGGQQTHLNQPGWAPVLKGKRVHVIPRGAEMHCTESVYVYTDTHTRGHSLDGTERLRHPSPGPAQ